MMAATTHNVYQDKDGKQVDPKGVHPGDVFIDKYGKEYTVLEASHPTRKPQKHDKTQSVISVGCPECGHPIEWNDDRLGSVFNHGDTTYRKDVLKAHAKTQLHAGVCPPCPVERAPTVSTFTFIVNDPKRELDDDRKWRLIRSVDRCVARFVPGLVNRDCLTNEFHPNENTGSFRITFPGVRVDNAMAVSIREFIIYEASEKNSKNVAYWRDLIWPRGRKSTTVDLPYDEKCLFNGQEAIFSGPADFESDVVAIRPVGCPDTHPKPPPNPPKKLADGLWYPGTHGQERAVRDILAKFLENMRVYDPSIPIDLYDNTILHIQRRQKDAEVGEQSQGRKLTHYLWVVMEGPGASFDFYTRCDHYGQRTMRLEIWPETKGHLKGYWVKFVSDASTDMLRYHRHKKNLSVKSFEAEQFYKKYLIPTPEQEKVFKDALPLHIAWANWWCSPIAFIKNKTDSGATREFGIGKLTMEQVYALEFLRDPEVGTMANTVFNANPDRSRAMSDRLSDKQIMEMPFH
tara:strand:- start:226 stop:1773 length:1548 start_codon:yes stop_codon:yes gene_type:complete